MGGADASRGFLIQTMIAVLGSLSDKEWVCLTIEPDEPSEKIDIRWEYPNKSVATQIKSSDNQITLSNAKKWAELLKTGEADEYNLILVGSCAQSVTDLGNYDGVEIPNPLPNNSGVLLDQASYLLSSFLERESFEPLPATSVKSQSSPHLVSTLFSYNQYQIEGQSNGKKEESSVLRRISLRSN